MKKGLAAFLCVCLLLGIGCIPAAAALDYTGYEIVSFEGFEGSIEDLTYEFGGQGPTSTALYTDEQVHGGEKSLKFTGRSFDSRRIKINGLLGKNTLTQQDLGDEYNISFWVYVTDVYVPSEKEKSFEGTPSDQETVTLEYGMYSSAGGTNPTSYNYGAKMKNFPVGEWTQVEFPYKVVAAGIHETDPTKGASCLGISAWGTDGAVPNTIYIDDVRAYQKGGTAMAGFNAYTLTDDAGTELDELTEGQTVKATATMMSLKKDAQTMLFVLCAKGPDGDLQDVSAATVTVGYEEVSDPISLSVTIGDDVGSVEGYLLNAATLMPYGEKKVRENVYPYDENEIVLMTYAPEEGKAYGGFDVYVKGSKKTGVGYTRYPFEYWDNPINPDFEFDTDGSSNDPANAKLFRIVEAYGVQRLGEFSFSSDLKIINNGEWEMAIREPRAGDFIGGFHGDEILETVKLTLDGKEVDLTTGPHKLTGTNLEFVQESYADRCNTPGSKVLKHTKRYQFDKNGLELYQKVEWLKEFELYSACLTMLPIMRCTDTRRIVDFVEVYDDDGALLKEYDTSSIGPKETLETEQIPNAARVHAYSADGLVDVVVKQTPVSGIFNRLTNINIREYGDNKVYMRSHAGSTAMPGDVWEMITNYKIDYRK